MLVDKPISRIGIGAMLLAMFFLGRPSLPVAVSIFFVASVSLTIVVSIRPALRQLHEGRDRTPPD